MPVKATKLDNSSGVSLWSVGGRRWEPLGTVYHLLTLLRERQANYSATVHHKRLDIDEQL